jgi:hypothetical protein
MAERQHFIPRLLLRGFAHRTKGNSIFVFLLRKGVPPREVSIANVAVARYFYGAPGEGPVDAILTGRESDYGSLLQELRREEVKPERKRLIDEFVRHLMVRTKNARHTVAFLGEAALDAIERELETSSRRAGLRQCAADDLRARPEVRDTLARLPRGMRRRAEREIEKALSRLDPRKALVRLRQELEKHDLSGAVRAAQLKALSTLGDSLASTGLFARFEWSVMECHGGTLILGDLGPLTVFGKQVRAPFHGGAAFEAVLLPVSSQRLLIGAVPGSPVSADVETINRASAAYSREFLVAAQNTDREQTYQALIGQKALDRPEWMDRAARRAFEERP